MTTGPFAVIIVVVVIRGSVSPVWCDPRRPSVDLLIVFPSATLPRLGINSRSRSPRARGVVLPQKWLLQGLESLGQMAQDILQTPDGHVVQPARGPALLAAMFGVAKVTIVASQLAQGGLFFVQLDSEVGQVGVYLGLGGEECGQALPEDAQEGGDCKGKRNEANDCRSEEDGGRGDVSREGDAHLLCWCDGCYGR